MAMSIPLAIALRRFGQLPQRSTEVWQGGVVKLPAWIDNPHDPDGPPYRPAGALWISLRTGIPHMAVPEDPGQAATPEFALRTLIEFGLKESKRLIGRPSVIEVRDAELRNVLQEALAPYHTTIALAEELSAIAEALRGLEAAAGNGYRQAGILEDTGVTVAQLRAFSGAAATFFQAAPWRHLANADLIMVQAPEIPKPMRHIVVLGNAGAEFGVAFFESRQAFERIYDGRSGLPRRAYGVTFGPIEDLPFADIDLWEALHLPVAGPRAYPLAADLSSDGTMRRLNADELVAAEAILGALAQITEDELDSGSWTHIVETSAGAVPLKLELPFLVEAEQGKTNRTRIDVLPRLAERASVRIARRLAGEQSLESLGDVNAALEAGTADDVLEMDADVAAGRPLTPAERAQALAYDAMETDGRLRSKLARRALALWPDCADACVILGDASASPEEAQKWYERGVDAGARAIGADVFGTRQTEFWSHVETRPYMRARLALAGALHGSGQEEQAVHRYRELLRLNPNDNQGVRHLLLPVLLERGEGEEADRLLREYDGDMQAMWPYGQALRAFRVEGDSARAQACLRNACRANPHVVDYLCAPETIPLEGPPHFALGSREEAAYVAGELHAAFAATPGALDWIRTAGLSRGSRRGPRARARSRRR
jgi:tetratricopeptide (TPR) repeat protein